MSKQTKIQELLIKHLMEKGHIELVLPDGFTLEVGIVQEGKNGALVKTDDYCWVVASQEDRTIAMDSYNLGLRFADENDNIIFEDSTVDHDGQPVRILNVA